jgi:hypothetical protein
MFRDYRVILRELVKNTLPNLIIWLYEDYNVIYYYRIKELCIKLVIETSQYFAKLHKYFKCS